MCPPQHSTQVLLYKNIQKKYDMTAIYSVVKIKTRKKSTQRFRE